MEESATVGSSGSARKGRRLRSLLHRAAEPQILFTSIGIFVLLLIWATTWTVIRVAHAGAERAAIIATRETTETYVAQVVRALREIDQTLKFVKYAYESKRKYDVLQELRNGELLPPEVIFSVSIADTKGNILASTRKVDRTNVADREYFQTARSIDSMVVGMPRKSKESGEWRIRFGRRLDNPDGTFAGVVLVGVDASYFVSNYETSRMGEHGVLGLLGTDGTFRARRTGDEISAADNVVYGQAAPQDEEPEIAVRRTRSVWDGVERFTSVVPLNIYSLTAVVGLSVDEQLAPVDAQIRTYLYWAAFSSLLVLAILGVIGRLSWQLTINRRRNAEARAQHAEHVEYLAYHDTLTALPNRSMFTRLLTQSIGHAQRYGSKLALLFIDLDRFKQINDTLGHDAGDQLLQEVAARLKTCLRESDMVARLGGDEFVALLPELKREPYAASVAQKILSSLAKPFLLRGQECRVTASIGISTFPDDGTDVDELTKCADIAMYQAKEAGKNNFQFYSPAASVKSLEMLTLESGLRRAIECDEFTLFYQAKRDTRTNAITGVEALLRWRHPDLGIVAPLRFLSVAEETGLIVTIGKWVLRKACEQVKEWERRGLAGVCVAVNMTARQFSDDQLLTDLATILADCRLPASQLELEIAESVLLKNFDKTMKTLVALKSMGVRVAIDDFGNSYFALSALQHLPIDTLKISRSLIGGIINDAPDKALAEAIIAMGKKLSLTVIAQGVETRAQADFLRERDCDQFQGFFFSEPMAPDTLAEMLAANGFRVTA